MFKNKRAIGFIVLLMIIVGLAPVAQAKKSDVFTGVTTARQKVDGQNLQGAINKAEATALDIAVQNALGTLLSREVIAANLDFVYNTILSKTKDYIITYRVLGGIEDKDYYLIGVESKVDLKLLKKTLTHARLLNANKDKPVVLFFMVEKTPADLLPRYWWGKNQTSYHSFAEQIIVSQMQKKKFMIVGNSEKRPDPSFYNITFKSIYDTVAAKDLGRQMKADMIVFGKATSAEAINRMGEQRTFNSTIQLDGYNLETGEKVVTSFTQAAVTSETNEEGNTNAIIKAAEESVLDLSRKIDAYWVKTLRKERAFEVKIQGENFHSRFFELTQRIKQMPEIENLQPKEMGTDYGILEIFYKGTPSQFADTLILKTFEDFGFEFLEVSDQLVSIQLIDKGPSLIKKPDNDRNGFDDTLE